MMQLSVQMLSAPLLLQNETVFPGMALNPRAHWIRSLKFLRMKIHQFNSPKI